MIDRPSSLELRKRVYLVENQISASTLRFKVECRDYQELSQDRRRHHQSVASVALQIALVLRALAEAAVLCSHRAVLEKIFLVPVLSHNCAYSMLPRAKGEVFEIVDEMGLILRSEVQHSCCLRVVLTYSKQQVLETSGSTHITKGGHDKLRSRTASEVAMELEMRAVDVILQIDRRTTQPPADVLRARQLVDKDFNILFIGNILFRELINL